jgi:hypothetical protein
MWECGDGGTYNGESREENQGHTDDMDRDINLIVVVGSVLAAAFIQISEGELERTSMRRETGAYENEVLLQVERHLEGMRRGLGKKLK